MYFTDITNQELCAFHGLNVPNFTIKLTDVLHQTSNVYDNKLFKIEEIVSDKVYKIYPMFYTGKIISSNPNDRIIDDKVIIVEKTSDVTYLTFISDENDDIQDYQSYGTYYNIGDTLTTSQFNSIVSLFRQFGGITKRGKLNQDIIQGDYGEYDFSIKTGFIDKGILINSNHLTTDTDFHIKLSNAIFPHSNYILQMKAMRITDVGVFGETNDDDDEGVSYIEVNVNLINGEYVHIPITDLQVGDILLYDCELVIDHTKPIIMYPKAVRLSSNPSSIQSGGNATLSAIVMNDAGDVLDGETVYFYEQFTPTGVLTGSPSVIQSGDTSTLTIKVKDSDGNLVSLNGATVKIYRIDGD